MSIKNSLQEAVKEAMRAKEKDKLSVLRLIQSEIKQVEIDNLRVELTDEQELAVQDKMQKQRRDSITQYKAAGRNDLADKEQFEIEIIQLFKPQQMTTEEVEQSITGAIKESGAQSIQDMKNVMALLKPKLQGRADLVQVGARVKALLSNSN